MFTTKASVQKKEERKNEFGPKPPPPSSCTIIKIIVIYYRTTPACIPSTSQFEPEANRQAYHRHKRTARNDQLRKSP